MCVWLAGFTPDSVPVDGSRPRFGHADHFSLVTSDGKEIPAWEGLVKEPALSVNEFGVEISIQAEDEETLMRSISRTGLTLRHRSEEGLCPISSWRGKRDSRKHLIIFRKLQIPQGT